MPLLKLNSHVKFFLEPSFPPLPNPQMFSRRVTICLQMILPCGWVLFKLKSLSKAYLDDLELKPNGVVILLHKKNVLKMKEAIP